MKNNKIVIANWKMNPSTVDEAVGLAKKIDDENLVICPPFPFLEAVGKIIKKAGLGSQNVFWENNGAYTGEISAKMLKGLGVKYVIIGHSERRCHLGETDEMIAKKVVAALRNDLIPILCVGETLEEHKAGRAKEVIERQLKVDLSLVASGYTLDPIIIAYEPVWAIGTGISDRPEDAVEIINFIKKTLYPKPYTPNLKVLYGGSVDSKNISGFMKYKEIEGVLVGGASLKINEIKKIIKNCKT